MWKFIMIAMFYSPSGQMLQEFPTPMSVNTEATCREMMNRYTQSKKNVVKNGKKYQLEVKTDCVFDPEPTTKTASAPDTTPIPQNPVPTTPADTHASTSSAQGTSDAPRVIPLYNASRTTELPAPAKAQEAIKPADGKSAGQQQEATASPLITSPTPAGDFKVEQRMDLGKPVHERQPVKQAEPVAPPAVPLSAKRFEQATREPVRPVEQAPPAPPLATEQKATEATQDPSPSPRPAPIQRLRPEPQVLPAPRGAPRESSSETERYIPGDLPRERASRGAPEGDQRQRRTIYEERRFAARRGGVGSDFPIGGFFSEPPPREPSYRNRFEREYEDGNFWEPRSHRGREDW
jgi:hypothetical protein